MNETNPHRLELLYEGSVKRVWRAPECAGSLWFEFTDDYSVFDWGKMPDTIANKGRALAVIGAYLFDELKKASFWKALPNSSHLKKFDQTWLKQRFAHRVFANQLCSEGVPSHFQHLAHIGGPLEVEAAARSAETVYMQVAAAKVQRPVLKNIQHQSVYVYPDVARTAERRLIPLEIVFRFGMPGGSSLIERLSKNPDYIYELGIDRPEPDQFFAHPVIEFYTKLEPKDRLLSWQEAVVMSGLTGEQFDDLVELSGDIALGLFVIFAERGIELWDGKVEMITQGDQVLLADSIGPDELRLLFNRVHLSKEMIRQYYRGSEWEVAIKDAQRQAKTEITRGWKEIAVKDFHAKPAPLPPSFKKLVDYLYGVLANTLVDSPLFPDHPDINEFVRLVPKLSGESLGQAELPRAAASTAVGEDK